MKCMLVIPCYEPSESVLPFLKQFKPGDFDAMLLFDDGSGQGYDDIFLSAMEETYFEVIRFPLNKGKGAMIKAGLLEAKRRKMDYVFTADSDGQHRYEDILRLKEEAFQKQGYLLLGKRDFSSKNVPFRSKFGNRFSIAYFYLSTFKKVHDTQTGLRGIPASLFDLGLESEGDRFEYEMNFLTLAVKEAPYYELPIETVYEKKGEHVSHFRTIVDSFRIYKIPFLYLLISLGCFGIDALTFHLLSSFVFVNELESQVFLSSLVARLISGAINFFALSALFSFRGGKMKSAGKYALVFALNLVLSSLLTYLFHAAPTGLTVLKIFIDIGLAIANYFVNLLFVFNKKRRKRKYEKEPAHSLSAR